MAKTKKTTIKPDFIVNLTNVESVEDINLAFIEGKIKAAKPISWNEYMMLIDIITDVAANVANDMFDAFTGFKKTNPIEISKKEFDEIVNIINHTQKKPWYKRFWNWLTRKK